MASRIIVIAAEKLIDTGKTNIGWRYLLGGCVGEMKGETDSISTVLLAQTSNRWTLSFRVNQVWEGVVDEGWHAGLDKSVLPQCLAQIAKSLPDGAVLSDFTSVPYLESACRLAGIEMVLLPFPEKNLKTSYGIGLA